MQGIGYYLASQHNTDMAGAWQDVHSLIWIACVRKDLLILFKPGIHLVPIKGHIAFDLRPTRYRIQIAPGGIFNHPGTSPDRPVRCVPFQRRIGTVLSSLHPLHSNIFDGEVENWQAPGFVQQHNMGAVSNNNTAENRTYAPATVFPTKA